MATKTKATRPAVSDETGLINIFKNQINPTFPIDFEREMNPGYGITFKRLEKDEIDTVITSRSFFLREGPRTLNDFFSVIDEPIMRTIKAQADTLFTAKNEGGVGNPDLEFLVNNGLSYTLYKSSSTKRTSDLTRYYYDLVEIVPFNNILAFAADCCEWNKLWTKWFATKPQTRNLDIGYCFLLDENHELKLYDVFMEHIPGKLSHLHCTPVPRVYKPGRYFLVPSRNKPAK